MYLTGSVPPTALNHPRADLGVMLQPGGGSGIGKAPLQFLSWAADNGCYAQGDRFDAGNWLEWLASLRPWRHRCLFAVAPDVYSDAQATWERSEPYLRTIHHLGFRAAYVSQDGETAFPQEADCLFIGGTDAWKLSEASYALAHRARSAGLWVHMGRVNSLQRLRAARISLIDSADGTFVRYGPDRRLPEVYDWLDQVNGAQHVMELVV